jgi:hypothetical protein
MIKMFIAFCAGGILVLRYPASADFFNSVWRGVVRFVTYYAPMLLDKLGSLIA